MPTISLSLTHPLYMDVLKMRKKGEDDKETIRRLIREAAESKAGRKDRIPNEPEIRGV